ncbi:signal peptidase I [Patescibacteria group bacterium]|nr:signal peptidase I [Patescibacteria group bacterium]
MDFDERDYFEELTPMQKVIHFVWDLLKVVVISLMIILPVRYFLIKPFYVKGASMEPSFYDNEYLIINEISYGLKIPFSDGQIVPIGEPNRGDIVVFRYPKDPSQYFIKRIVGLPGEKIEIVDEHIYIYTLEGKKFMIDESAYLPEGLHLGGPKTWELNKNEYYVMGDNREFSLDSRSFGPLNRELIVGKVWLRGWPIWRLTVFPEVDYGITVENN